MNIGSRLKQVGDLVNKSSSVMDIGCDNSYLDIYLAEKKELNLKKIIASDNKEGPLKQAKRNIKTYKVEKKIILKLGDGLSPYEKDIDTIIISGMGGRNMIGIFKEHLEYLKHIQTIILSPNNYQIDIKKFLVNNGYFIKEEHLVKEGKFIYQVIKFEKGKVKYTKREYFFGPLLLKEKNNLFIEYYARELKSREILFPLLPQNYYLKKWKMKREIKILKEVLKKE